MIVSSCWKKTWNQQDKKLKNLKLKEDLAEEEVKEMQEVEIVVDIEEEEDEAAEVVVVEMEDKIDKDSTQNTRWLEIATLIKTMMIWQMKTLMTCPMISLTQKIKWEALLIATGSPDSWSVAVEVEASTFSDNIEAWLRHTMERLIVMNAEKRDSRTLTFSLDAPDANTIDATSALWPN